jgi:murein DD-endopeptidase MepM/ murein hydrolase activator NlpD
MGRVETALSPARRRLVGGAAAFRCAAGLVVTGALPAPAADDPGARKRVVDRKIDALENHLDDTSAALDTAYSKLNATKSKLPGAQAALEKAQASAEAADHAHAVVAAGRKRIAQFAAQIYQEQGFGQLDVALSSTEPQQFADRLAMVDTVLDVQSSTMTRLTTEQANLTAMEDHLSALRADSDAKKKAAAAALAKAQAARDASAKAKADLEALAAQQQKQTAAFEDQVAADKKQLSAMKSEQAKLQRILAARAAEARRKAAEAARKRAAAEAAARKRAAQQNKPAPPPAPSGGSSSGSSGGGSSSSSGYLSRPVRTGWVSSEFGMRFHPIYHEWRLHSGRDYAVPCGTPVYASAGGTVIMAGWGGGYGNRIVIDHGLVRGSGLASTYNHLSRIVTGGGHVSRGQLIGYSGTTGTSTGCHLHYETLQNGSFVDPRGWLNTLG